MTEVPAELPNRFTLEVKETIRNEVDYSPVVRKILRELEEEIQERLEGYVFEQPDDTVTFEHMQTLTAQILRVHMDDPKFDLEFVGLAQNKIQIVPLDEATEATLKKMVEGWTEKPDDSGEK